MSFYDSMGGVGAMVASERAEALPVSVVIPSYRGGKRLVELVESLIRCNDPPGEIVVVVDDPDPETLQALKSLSSSVPMQLLAREGRRGKVSAVNEAVKLAKCDTVLFLDDDVLIEDPHFFSKVYEAMRDCDLLDIKKRVAGEGLLAKLVHIEYTAYNFASKLMAKLARRTIAINGAAFAVKRSALESVGSFRPRLSEDFDLALRLYLKGCRFSFLDSTYVLNYAPSSWTHWLKQRKRWAVAFASWLRENFWTVLKVLVRMPHAILPGLLLSMPALLTTAVLMGLRDFAHVKLAYALLLPLSSLARFLLPAAAALSITLHVAYATTTLAILIFIVAFAVANSIIARLMGMKPHTCITPIYLLVYQVLWLTILLVGLIRVFVFNNERVEDWVV
ncbi:MAG: glycosyltransferase family 2 protein [Thermofilaceae archaeon]